MGEESKIRFYESPSSALDEGRGPRLDAVCVADELQEVPNLLEYWRIIRKRRGAILTSIFIVFTIALVATLKQKPVYRGRTLVEIQKENPDIPSYQELLQVENISDTYLETQYRILKSENLARRVIFQLRLDQVAEFAPSNGTSTKDSLQEPTSQVSKANGEAPRSQGRRRELDAEVLKKFQDRLDVEPLKRSRLVEVSFESNDPNLAAQVSNSVASTFIQQNIEARWEASQRASEWLSRQLLEMKAKLERSEDELQHYAKENGLLFLETGKGTTENIVAQRLRELQEELTKAQAERYAKESMYRLLSQGDTASLPGVFDNKLMQDLTEKLAELERERSRLATIFTPDYPRVKEIQSQIDATQAVLAAERERAATAIANDFHAAAEREQLLQAAFKEQQRQSDLVAEKSVQYNILKREADTNKQLYVGLLEKLKETGVTTSLKATNVRIVDTAFPPQKQVRPRVFLNLSLGLALGLCLGIGAAFLQEHLDNTFKSMEEIKRSLQLPALASVPAVAALNGRSGVHALYERARGLAVEKGKSGERDKPGLIPAWNRIEGNGDNAALAEAFHELRTSVLLSTVKRPPTSILITSAQGGEGKTTVACNLAVSLAQISERVLLIDADLRRPSVHSFFGIPNASGLVDYLTGEPDWRSLVCHAAPVGLDVLFCGPVPPNPADLLSSEHMRSLVSEAAKEYKFVVLDSPPLLSLADSRILATMVDGVILVVGGGVTPRDLVHRAYISALDTGSHVLGATINFADASLGYYSTAYNTDKPEPRR